MNLTPIAEFSQYIDEASSIAVLTGAGISTPSGIPDFRSDDGLYSNPENAHVFDISAFMREPKFFYQFAQRFYPTVAKAEPNAAHLYLAELEKLGTNVHIATQNIDDLHARAGSQRVYYVHGNVEVSTCMSCGESFKSQGFLDDIAAGYVPHCGCGGVIKPNITFFGEGLPEEAWASSVRAMNQADLVIVIGSSLVVFPAAGLPQYRRPDAKLVIVNRDPTELDSVADLVVRDDIAAVFAALKVGSQA